jgi:radical SAM protein with 4Fe4S-binding SPASM domain
MTIKRARVNGFSVGVFYPVFKQNIADIEETTAILRDANVTDIKFIRVRPFGNATNLPDQVLLTQKDMPSFLGSVDATRLRYPDVKLTLFGESFGPNFFGSSIYTYLAGDGDRWPGSTYVCPMVNGQFIGVSYGTNNAYPCFEALSFPELINGTYRNGVLTTSGPVVSDASLSEKLRGMCAKHACEYQDLCMGGCRITAFAVAKRNGENDPLYAGQDICVTNLLSDIAGSV